MITPFGIAGAFPFGRPVERIAHPVEREAVLGLARGRLGRELFGPSPKVFCQLAEVAGRPAGFALWYYTFSTFQGRHGIWLEDLFVNPEMRGHGVGKALLTDLARCCVREGLGRYEWAVLDWNQPSIDFYVSQGAIFLDSWRRCRVTGDALSKLGRPE